MEDFSLSNILSIKQNKETKDSDIIKYHYNQIVPKIRASYNNYLDYCYYRVPEFTARLPPYENVRIAKKIVKYMTRKGFTCKLAFDSNIYFEWNPKKRPTDHIPFIMKAVTKRIEIEANNNHDYLFYDIPVILPEFPWYDTEETTIIIAREIASKGFIVKIMDNVVFICWNKKQIEKRSNITIDIETKEEKRQRAMEKIDYINENRYDEFMNPKVHKKSSSIDMENIKTPKAPKFDVSGIVNLYGR